MDLNFNNKCRACLAENEAMLSLFEIYEHELTLAMILQSCISTEVNVNDGLPAHLCDSCILVLTQFYNFTVVYDESDKQLRSLLKESKKLIQLNESTNEGESETPTGANELHVTVEIPQEDVAMNSEDQEPLEYYAFKNVDYNLVEPEAFQENQVIQEFKKELLSAEDLESIQTNRNEYLEIHISESNEGLIKQEAGVFKQENPIYEEIVKYECTICGEAHLYASSFQQHMRVKHQMQEIDCKEFATNVRVKINQRTENYVTNSLPQIEILDTDPTHKCKFCDKLFHTTTQLQQHSKLHDANKKYVCEICGSRFIRKTYLADHMEGHSTEKKHSCKFCGKAFRRRTVLRAHKRVHTHPNHYVCEICGRAFTNSSTLKTHRLLLHVKERNFNCVICGLSFPLKSTLNKHLLRHQKRENGEKGFNCTECDMEYRDKSSLKRHIETKHQGRIQYVSCPDCPKKYTSKANLMKHRRRHHVVVLDDGAEVIQIEEEEEDIK